MSSCVHIRQREESHMRLAGSCCGHQPGSLEPRIMLTLCETDSVFHAVILDEWPGPAVDTYVGDYKLDRWPKLTAERAQSFARFWVGLRD